MGYGTTEAFLTHEPTFEEFVWRCARATMMFIHMRDMDLDAPLVMPSLKNDDYYFQQLEKASRELKHFSEMTVDEAQVIMEKEYNKMIADAQETIQKHGIIRARYESMITKVTAWNAPSPEFEDFKKFMLDQLTRSRDSDCNDKYWQERLDEPHQTAEEWLADRIHSAKHDIEYYTKRLAEQKQAFNHRINQIETLMSSVPIPENMKSK